jgi:hypothetical protein
MDIKLVVLQVQSKHIPPPNCSLWGSQVEIIQQLWAMSDQAENNHKIHLQKKHME